MRFALFAALLAAAGCTSGNGTNGGTDDPPAMTPGDVPREMKQVLQTLEIFEGHDLDAMDQAAVDLLAATPQLVSPDLRTLLERYQKPATRDNAADGLRAMSRRCRTLLLLDMTSEDPDVIKNNWAKCRDRMLAAGPADTAFFIGMLVIKFEQQPSLARGLLMDMVNSIPQIAVPVLQEVLRHRPGKELWNGPFPVTAIHEPVREALCQLMILVEKPPTAAIREIATDHRKYPDSSRRLMAKWLGKKREANNPRGAAPAWAVEILVAQLRDPEWEVRADAALGLGYAGNPQKAVPALILALKDEDFFVRKKVLNGLSLYGALANEAVPAIFEMLEDKKDEAYRRAEIEKSTIFTLETITGKRFQGDLDIWKAWYDENKHQWGKK